MENQNENNNTDLEINDFIENIDEAEIYENETNKANEVEEENENDDAKLLKNDTHINENEENINDEVINEIEDKTEEISDLKGSIDKENTELLDGVLMTENTDIFVDKTEEEAAEEPFENQINDEIRENSEVNINEIKIDRDPKDDDETISGNKEGENVEENNEDVSYNEKILKENEEDQVEFEDASKLDSTKEETEDLMPDPIQDVIPDANMTTAESEDSPLKSYTPNKKEEYIHEYEGSNVMANNDNGRDFRVKSDSNSTIEMNQFDHLPESFQNRKAVSALTPVFSFGYNRQVPIINLSTDKRRFIFYSSSHLAIVYDYFHNEQMILQGHCNTITCTTSSKDKRWLASGDKGENSAVIIWDCNTGHPVRSMFEPHPNGVVAIALTSDARYLATLSAETTQTLAIWDWTTGDDIPLCSSSLSSNYDVQNFIHFNEEDPFQVATNSETQVLFYQWDKIGNMKYFAPKLTDKDFNKLVGKFSNTVYLPRSMKAITATSQGLLVVWEENLSLMKVSNEATADKKAVKLVPVHEKGINVLTLIDCYIVTGDAAGEIKFFDFNFMLIFWYKDWNFGPISSISPSNNKKIEKLETTLEKSNYPGDATIQNNRFCLRDFIVGTATTIFATVRVEGSKIKIIFREHDQMVFSIAAHPTLPLVATGSYSGLLKIWDYEEKRSLKTRLFNKDPIRCLCFDHTGLQLAIGFTNGEVRILDTFALKDVTKAPFHFSKVNITHISFSERSEFLATVDANCTTTLYKPGDKNAEEPWIFVARYRAHYKPIVDLLFGYHFDTEIPRMFTLGEDRRLVEYDLANVSEDNLPILQELRIEQHATPRAMCWYPEQNGEGFLVTANDEYKMKMYNHQTKMCRYTFLGPSFGSPVQILKPLPVRADHTKLNDGTSQRYIAYTNKDKIGLMRMPFDGNPYNYMTMIAHPKGVTNMCCSFDGNYLISVGEDFIVSVWKVNVDILENQVRQGGSDMTPYYELIEGGEFGPFMHELKDYFYYSMIRTQGIDSLDTRKVNVVIDISEGPYIMRAIGFYPSEEEIENMVNQLKYRNYFLTGECSTNVDMDTFLKLYINHRPAFGIPSSKIEDAFKDILKTSDEELSIDSFLDLLINRGENILEDDLAEYLATLLGFNSLGGSLEMESIDHVSVMETVNNVLPKAITPKTFIEDILCMKVIDNATVVSNKVPSSDVATDGTQT